MKAYKTLSLECFGYLRVNKFHKVFDLELTSRSNINIKVKF